MNETIVPIRRALISVFDKRGLIELAQVLAATRHAAHCEWRQPISARGGRSRCH